MSNIKVMVKQKNKHEMLGVLGHSKGSREADEAALKEMVAQMGLHGVNVLASSDPHRYPSPDVVYEFSVNLSEQDPWKNTVEDLRFALKVKFPEHQPSVKGGPSF